MLRPPNLARSICRNSSPQNSQWCVRSLRASTTNAAIADFSATVSSRCCTTRCGSIVSTRVRPSENAHVTPMATPHRREPNAHLLIGSPYQLREIKSANGPLHSPRVCDAASLLKNCWHPITHNKIPPIKHSRKQSCFVYEYSHIQLIILRGQRGIIFY